MNAVHALLAESTNTGLIKVVLFVAFIVINLIASAVKKSKKDSEQRARDLSMAIIPPVVPPTSSPTVRRAPSKNMPFKTIGAEVAARRERMLSDSPRNQPSAKPGIQQSLSEAINLAQAARRAKGSPKVKGRQPAPKQKTAPAQPPSVPRRVASSSPSISDAAMTKLKPDIASSEIHSIPTMPTLTAKHADATSLRAWLRPMTMQQQFMLTEVLQKPLSLRD